MADVRQVLYIPLRYWMGNSRHGFHFQSADYLDIQVSYYVMGAIRKLFNPRTRKEGEALNPLSLRLQKSVSGLTHGLDRHFPMRKDLTLMVFRKDEK